jgi:WD40 repeat protein
LLAISIKGGKIGVWTFESGKPFATFTGPQSEVISLRFSPDWRCLLAIYDDGSARLFRVVPPIEEVKKKAEGIVRALHRVLSPADVNRYLSEGILD